MSVLLEPRSPLTQRLVQPVSPASLAVFRIAFGVLMAWEVSRYFTHDWIQRYYITPRLHFTYYGFGWIAPWPADGMTLHFCALGVLAVAIALGLLYRVAAALFCAGFTYVFLLDQARYLNHFYLIALLSFLLACVPAHTMWSLDARRGRWRDRTVPAWTLWLLRFQLAMPYIYGGIAKLNGDWLRGAPLRDWLADRAGLAMVGPWLTTQWAPWVFVYGGIAVDLLVVPLVMWRRTRWWGLSIAAAFHGLNSQLFSIGVFPPLALAGTLLFLPADWPIRARELLLRCAAAREDPIAPATSTSTLSRSQLFLLAVYVVVQVLVPLRHHLYPGPVAWTEEGHRFSWRMKLRDKEAEAHFVATDPASGRSWTIDNSRYLARWQEEEMASRPDMILQFAHVVGRELSVNAGRPIQVGVRAVASLNGRPPQPLIDPGVDLMVVPRTLRSVDWIVPLREELPPRSTTTSRARRQSR